MSLPVIHLASQTPKRSIGKKSKGGRPRKGAQVRPTKDFVAVAPVSGAILHVLLGAPSARSLNCSRCCFSPFFQWCHKRASFLKRGVHAHLCSKRMIRGIQ